MARRFALRRTTTLFPSFVLSSPICSFNQRLPPSRIAVLFVQNGPSRAPACQGGARTAPFKKYYIKEMTRSRKLHRCTLHTLESVQRQTTNPHCRGRAFRAYLAISRNLDLFAESSPNACAKTYTVLAVCREAVFRARSTGSTGHRVKYDSHTGERTANRGTLRGG